MVKLLAISGSLRRASSNTALLQAACALAKDGIQIELCSLICALPLFSPDLENPLPEVVTQFRKQVQLADGLIIASPEYAHGVTGAIKNALDWLVSGPEFIKKPVAILNAAPRSTHAYESLKEIVKTMDGHIVEKASLLVPLPNNKITKEGCLADPALSLVIQEAILAMQAEIRGSI